MHFVRSARTHTLLFSTIRANSARFSSNYAHLPSHPASIPFTAAALAFCTSACQSRSRSDPLQSQSLPRLCNSSPYSFVSHSRCTFLG